ncbi:hypothetical protein [Nocardioides litoris]|uniref:hypothetical protein n=1 Tax=Nocardioides litoris TaxID=1926648 RepID=UPI00147690C8|nr:hypothetical protein [Nocardioides litoris]
MDWSRSPVTRALALITSLALVVLDAAERGTWFWVGVVFTVANIVGLVAERRRGRAVPPPLAAAGVVDRRDEAVLEPSVDGSNAASDNGDDTDDTGATLADLLADPAVADALDAGPTRWQQVALLDEPVGPSTARELAGSVRVGDDRPPHDWYLAVGEELSAHLDLDTPEEDDAAIAVLEAHPDVAAAVHVDREVYGVEELRPMPLPERARLAAQALVAHQVAAAGARAGIELLDDGVGLRFTCGSLPVEPALRRAGREPDARLWAGLVWWGFPAAGDVEVDAKGSTFTAWGSTADVAALRVWLLPHLLDPSSATTLLARAERDGADLADLAD